jgi:AraC family transcriptional activator of pobA
VLVSGKGTYLAGDSEHEVEEPCMIWSPTRHTTRLAVAAGSRGFVLRVPEKIIGGAMPTGTISAHVRKALAGRMILPDLPSSRLAKLENHFEFIEAELQEMGPGAHTVIHHSISLLLIEIWRASSPLHNEVEMLPQQIVDDFLHLVELHLQNHCTVADYAQQIGVSRDKLNTAVRRAIGATPHQHIQSRLMEEAKSLLLHSNLHVAEIAYKLGFSDAAYFNRFFQRHATVAPGRFRQMNLERYRPGRKETSFAAWP